MQGYRATSAPETAADADNNGALAQTGTKLDAMLDFIDANLAEPLRLEALAARAGASRAHFVRRFRRLTGFSPHRYLTQRRIEKAKELLRGSRRNLADIALDVGFGNQSHFTQVFHQNTGMTPASSGVPPPSTITRLTRRFCKSSTHQYCLIRAKSVLNTLSNPTDEAACTVPPSARPRP